MGVWIETSGLKGGEHAPTSHPSWVCGLKLSVIMGISKELTGHTLRGCADWNSPSAGKVFEVRVTPFVGVWIETNNFVASVSSDGVTPFVGVWIETSSYHKDLSPFIRHTLRGCVDWNLDRLAQLLVHYVTPFVGVWIETENTARQYETSLVTPFVGVWIET